MQLGFARNLRYEFARAIRIIIVIACNLIETIKNSANRAVFCDVFSIKKSSFTVFSENLHIFGCLCAEFVLESQYAIGGNVKNTTKFFQTLDVGLRATLLPRRIAVGRNAQNRVYVFLRHIA